MAQVYQLVCYLQSMRGRRLWAHEDTSCSNPNLTSLAALRTLVQSTVGALHWVEGLQVCLSKYNKPVSLWLVDVWGLHRAALH
jgi:hypothetical protein